VALRRVVRQGAARLALLLAPVLLRPTAAGAQELEPRAYSASPVGANFAGVSYQYSWGALVFDPTIPITDADAKLNGVTLGYGRTFSLCGTQALATAALPYIWGSFSGTIAQQEASTARSGIGDLRARLSVNLIGGPALDPRAFVAAPRRSLVGGMSLTVSAPTGENYPDKLINIGANRWGFKPEAGISCNWRRKWYADLYGAVWLFTANTAAYPGTSRRQQDPLASVQGHLSYTLARRSWAALDATWFWGGASHVDGGPAVSRIDNKRVGAVLAMGITDRQSVKLAYSYGASTRVGEDFGTVALAYQTVWF
jgi:hypothetical protein